MVARAIEARRQEAAGGADDLLDYMLKAQDPETGRRMSPTDLLHDMQFFIVAGHETTALALPGRCSSGSASRGAGQRLEQKLVRL